MRLYKNHFTIFLIIFAMSSFSVGSAFAVDRSECRPIAFDEYRDCPRQTNKEDCENCPGGGEKRICEWYQDTQPNLANIRIHNHCVKPIRISLAVGSFGWSNPPSAFHEVAAGQLTDYLLTTGTGEIYFYAETIDQPGLQLFWSANDVVQAIQGSQQKYGFVHQETPSDLLKNYTLSIICDGVDPFHHMSLFWSGSGVYGVGLGNSADEAKTRAQQFCDNGGANPGCVESFTVDAKTSYYLIMAGGDGNKIASGISQVQQTAINDAMNNCYRVTTNCRIIGEHSN